jgi:methionine sulfoxide reductase heme-binding subunit
MTRRSRDRVLRHLALGVGSSLATWGIMAGMSRGDPIFRLSLATAYVALVLLVAALLIGPLNVLRGRANPVSTNYRRDVGIWSGIFTLVHLIAGLQVHLRGKMWQYFLYPTEWERAFPFRYDTFGLANWTGLIGGLVVVLLLVVSNDLSLRALGTTRWKSIQRWNYAAFVLVVVHGVIYQLAIESRPMNWIVIFDLLVLLTVVAQVAGFGRMRRQRRAKRSK